MTARFVAVLSVPAEAPQAPPGIDAGELRLAMLEDTYEVVAGLELVTPALVLHPPAQPDAEAITWPGTQFVRAASLSSALTALQALGAEEAALVAPDAPDLPPLLIGKLFRALGTSPVAVCPSSQGGLVALAVKFPAPDWLATGLAGADMALGTPDLLTHLRAAAPRSGMVYKGPGWHRLRTPQDLGLLDPGLEGWENTRALLEGHPLPS